MVKNKTIKNKTVKKHTGSRHSNTRKRNIKKPKRKFIIGIVSVPLSPEKKFFKVCGDSYIASSHLKWLKSQECGDIDNSI